MTKQQAIQHYGSVAALAAVLNVRVQAVYQWKTIPMLRQYELERATDGKLVAGEAVSDQEQAA